MRLSVLYSVILILPALFTSCERNDYEILSPEEAGQWTSYTTADGLPGNRVSDIMHDTRDNLWFTCPGYGTAKFDRETLTYYRAATTPILNDAVNCIDESSDGSILFGTGNGLSVMSPDDDWSSYIDPVNVLFINAIKVSSNSWIWLGTQSQGLYLNKGSGFVKILSEEYRNIYAVEEGIPGNIFIGTDNGIVKYDGANYSTITVKDGLPGNMVSSLRFDSRERLWIGTYGGKYASWIDRTGVMNHLNLMAGTDSILINDIFEDTQGNIWFATTGNGLIMYDGVITQSFKEYNGLPENSVNCIEEDADGNLWFGLNSKGVVKYTLPVKFK